MYSIQYRENHTTTIDVIQYTVIVEYVPTCKVTQIIHVHRCSVIVHTTHYSSNTNLCMYLLYVHVLMCIAL